MFADAVDPHEDLIAFSDERRAAHGGNDLAVADEIAFLHGEIEFAVAGLTLPPPICAAYSPSPMVRIISSSSSLPGAINVLRMRLVGA